MASVRVTFFGSLFLLWTQGMSSIAGRGSLPSPIQLICGQLRRSLHHNPACGGLELKVDVTILPKRLFRPSTSSVRLPCINQD